MFKKRNLPLKKLSSPRLLSFPAPGPARGSAGASPAAPPRRPIAAAAPPSAPRCAAPSEPGMGQASQGDESRFLLGTWKIVCTQLLKAEPEKRFLQKTVQFWHAGLCLLLECSFPGWFKGRPKRPTTKDNSYNAKTETLLEPTRKKKTHTHTETPKSNTKNGLPSRQNLPSPNAKPSIAWAEDCSARFSALRSCEANCSNLTSSDWCQLERKPSALATLATSAGRGPDKPSKGAQQGMRHGMTLVNHPLWLPLRESLGSFPHSLTSEMCQGNKTRNVPE